MALAAVALSMSLTATRQLATLRREQSTLRRQVEESARTADRVQKELKALGTDVTLYFIDETPTSLRLAPEKRKILTSDLPAGVVGELIKGPAPGSRLRPSLPSDTVLNGVKIRESVAYVDLGGGITRLNVGSEGEAALVGSLVRSLTGLPGVKQVQIMVNGAVVESLAGHVDVSRPLTSDTF